MSTGLQNALRRGILPAGIALLVAGVACTNDECMENKNSLPLAGFYSSEAVPVAISVDSVTIYGIGAPGDSVLHDSVRNLKQSYLPFRIDQESTSYVIRYLQGELGRFRIADTITFNYDIVPWFVSSSCGVVYEYRMRDIVTTHHVIDSVTCPGGVIDNKNSENLRIYFRVAREEEQP